MSNEQLLLMVVVGLVLFLFLKSENFLSSQPANFKIKNNYCNDKDKILVDCDKKEEFANRRKLYHEYNKDFKCGDNFKVCDN